MLILIRHGQSQWNLENKFTGWVDVPITEKGAQEARDAAVKLKNYIFDYGFTSLLQRAQKTLEIILNEIGQSGLSVVKHEALNERMYGDLQGLEKAETALKFGEEQVKIWRRSYDIAPPNGESLKDTAARVLPYYHENIEPLLRQGKNVIISAHGNSLRALIMELEKMSSSEILEFEIPTATPRIYTFDDSFQVIEKRFL